MEGRIPVFDAHVDSLQRALDLDHDLGRETPGHLDLVRGKRGGLSSVVLVCFVDPAYLDPKTGGPAARAALLLREAHKLAARHPDQLALVGNGAELERAHQSGRIAGIPGIEGGHAIEEELERLQWFFDRGLRVMTLVWNNHLSWIRSCQPEAGPEIPEGLSGFGREVVREMNRLGMVIDLSHAGEQSFYDVLATTSRPVIASHSGCRALHDHQRNLDDAQLRALAQNGGVVGIVFHPGFLDAGARAEEVRLRKTDGYRALKGKNESEKFLLQGEFMEQNATPMPAERLTDHVMHAIEIAGVDHVGLGSDFDGIERGPKHLDDASCYGFLATLLEERGLGEDDVRAVMAGNMERVFAEVTGVESVASNATVQAHLD